MEQNVSKVRNYDDSSNIYKHQVMTNAIRSLHSSMNASRVVDVSGQLSDLMVSRPKTNHIERGKDILGKFRSESLVSLEDKARSSIVNFDELSGNNGKVMAVSMPGSFLGTGISTRKSTQKPPTAFTTTNYSSFDPRKRSTLSTFRTKAIKGLQKTQNR